jgi:hypothetical protein
MNIAIERLVEIESEREQTMSDPSFQSWMKEIGVSVVYKDREPVLRAREMNADYDFSKLFIRRSKLMSYIQ